jgi:glutathione S-transferase
MHGGGAADDAKVAHLAKTLASRLQAYDVILSKQKYLAGDELSIADLFHLYVLFIHLFSSFVLAASHAVGRF